MSANILEDKRNDLFNRKEVSLEIVADSTPSYVDATKIVVDNFKAKEEQIAIKNVLGKFGSTTFKIVAFIYDSSEDKELNEPKPKEKKK